MNIVQGYVTRGVLAEEALKELRAILAEDPVPLPDGYRYQFGGTADARASVVQNIIAPMGMVVAALRLGDRPSVGAIAPGGELGRSPRGTWGRRPRRRHRQGR